MDEHLDILIIGAGISGISAAHHLQEKCPSKSFAILETRGSIGGTWDLFRYPGIRSDSDMHTLGYRFKLWSEAKSTTDGASILEYLRQTAHDDGTEERIRFHHRVVAVEWSSEDARWSVEVKRSDTGETVRFACWFLLFCSGYFRYHKGFLPRFPGAERFDGRIVHPQHWPENLDVAGRRVVVIGSGATAITLVPTLAKDAEHVTMLQRSPTYVVSVPADDPIATALNRLLPSRFAYAVVRWKNILLQLALVQFSYRWPNLVRALIRRGAQRRLPAGYDIDRHFNPRYKPWDQRMCLIPDGDLFRAISDGDASVVTDEIETFTATGVALRSGETLRADLIVAATGLSLLFLGGVRISVDGEEVSPSERLAYKGLMLSGVPNLAFTIGYVTASWTLRVDLTAEYVCRVIRYMTDRSYSSCVPEPEASVTKRRFPGLRSGYVLRSIRKFPKQGSADPWRVRQNYLLEHGYIRFSPVDDGTMRFFGHGAYRVGSRSRLSTGSNG